jgi:hypothetical protein
VSTCFEVHRNKWIQDIHVVIEHKEECQSKK